MKLQVKGEIAQAEVIYQALLKKNPQNYDALHLLGLVRMLQGQTTTAIQLITQAIALRDDMPAFHHNIAGLYRRRGEMDKAREAYRNALRLKPDYGEACQGLVEIVKIGQDDPIIAQALEQSENSQLDNRIKSYFHFSLGKIFDDTGDYSKAFSHYQQANELAGRTFDVQHQRNLVQEILYHYGPQCVSESSGPNSELPVFIVGMPRSGTSLVEQILASHSRVFGAGELGDISGIIAHCQSLDPTHQRYPLCIKGLEPAHYQGLGQRYLQRLTSLAGEDVTQPQRIIDKHPLNFQHLGFIFNLLPGARVIHTRRNSLDTCLSCFFQNFSSGQDYSFDLTTLAQFYLDYERLMQHWQDLYPDKIFVVDYENLVEDQESISRQLIHFLGLDWEAALLDFHSIQREVKTASFLQVRQPVYKNSVARWQHYRPYIAGLAHDLGMSI